MNVRLKRTLVVAALAAGAPALGQAISNLERDRPVSLEDARPTDRGAFSGSFEIATASRLDDVNYTGVGLAVLFGAARGLEVGVETQLVTNPRSNSSRGIGSGNLDLHVLANVAGQSHAHSALSFRVDGYLPTGIASHGSNLSAEALATRSFEYFQLSGNFGDLYIGNTRPSERRNRLFAILGGDFSLYGPWQTDTLFVADVRVIQSIQTGGDVTVGLEAGIRQRMGMRTILFLGFLSEVAGDPDRSRYRALIGLTQIF